jgi:hypothetical protein
MHRKPQLILKRRVDEKSLPPKDPTEALSLRPKDPTGPLLQVKDPTAVCLPQGRILPTEMLAPSALGRVAKAVPLPKSMGLFLKNDSR